jgi:hypothetical protein
MTPPGKTADPSGSVRVQAPEIREMGDRVRLLYRVEGLKSPVLWFEVDAEYRHWISESMDAALTALLGAAMDVGEGIHLDGPTSARLLWNLQNTVIPVVTRQLPFLRPVPVTASEVRRECEREASAVLTGFSCGVDSFSALKDHLLSDVFPVEDRVTHLLFSHVGHHGYGPEVNERAERRWQRIRAGAEDLGLPMVKVASNTPAFYSDDHDSRLNWAAILTVRNSAVPLFLQNGVRRFLHASSHAWSDIGVFPTRDMTKADPILLPALGTERTELCAVGTEHTRVEKTRRISDLDLARRYLDVCIMDGDRNCSRCEKCLRTILTLDLLGTLDRFQDRFDLDEYRRNRDRFTAQVITERENVFHTEIRELMKDVRFRPSLTARGWVALTRGWRALPRGLRRALRRPPRR